MTKWGIKVVSRWAQRSSQDQAVVFTSQYGATPTRHGLAKQEPQLCLKRKGEPSPVRESWNPQPTMGWVSLTTTVLNEVKGMGLDGSPEPDLEINGHLSHAPPAQWTTTFGPRNLMSLYQNLFELLNRFLFCLIVKKLYTYCVIV